MILRALRFHIEVSALEKSSKIWINGDFVDWDEAKIHVLTHALHCGTAVFEE